MWTARFLSAALLLAGLATAADAKTLTFCAPGGPEGFDPALHTAAVTFDASSAAIYDRLVAFEKGTTKPVQGLATSWDVSEDGLEYTFHLRPGVKFQTTAYFTPSRELNADDVVFSFVRQLKKDSPYFDYAGGEWPYLRAMSLPALIKSVERIDDATVKFTLARAEAAFVADLGMDFASIVSKEYADKLLAAKNRQDLDHSFRTLHRREPVDQDHDDVAAQDGRFRSFDGPRLEGERLLLVLVVQADEPEVHERAKHHDHPRAL